MGQWARHRFAGTRDPSTEGPPPPLPLDALVPGGRLCIDSVEDAETVSSAAGGGGKGRGAPTGVA
jgi:hypothetical protein